MATWTEEQPPESEEFYRILDADGSLQGDPPDLDEEKLLGLYRTFVLTRTLEDKMLNMQRRGEISLVARSRGEEATPLGSAAALAPDDWIFPLYRQKPAMLYWGMSMAGIIAEHRGIEPTTVEEHIDAEEPDVNFSPDYTPVGVNVSNAVGSAMADRFNDRDTVTLAYIGDGSTSEGGFYEGLNFAGVFDAPAVIICQNNQWAISVPQKRQTAAETFAQKADAAGIPNERIDGNDVFAVYERTKEAVENAREGGGTTVIECVTYRQGAHNTSDNPDLYREGDSDQQEYWAEHDPVDRFEAYLADEGILDDEQKAEIDDETDERVQEAVEQARNVPAPEPERMFDNHFHETPWNHRHQRAELQRELDGENPFTDFDGGGFDE